MPTFDDDLLDWDGPSTDRIERVVTRALRRLAWVPDDPQEDPTPEPSFTADDALDHMTSTLRHCGLLPNPLPLGEPHPLASTGPKLKELRTKSGWTVEEVAERTGMSPDLLSAFEDGDSSAAGELTTFDLERLASACCGTLADLLGPKHPWVLAARRRHFRSDPCTIDPHG